MVNFFPQTLDLAIDLLLSVDSSTRAAGRGLEKCMCVSHSFLELRHCRENVLDQPLEDGTGAGELGWLS